MLWTAYLMILENDGLNERQLRECARLDGWLRAFWFEEDGASCARLAIHDNAWPPNNDFSAVTMWLFWFLLRPVYNVTDRKRKSYDALAWWLTGRSMHIPEATTVQCDPGRGHGRLVSMAEGAAFEGAVDPAKQQQQDAQWKGLRSSIKSV
ncbi:hypothetical protein EDB89DRAFT_2063107 [Lactarius sanguifluus]|nr:hypothetical protein EDB89DRAFT_2063107 [Lactarius sanguifluus]